MIDPDAPAQTEPAAPTVLAGYQPPTEGFDEARAPDGVWRPHWTNLVQKLEEQGASELAARWKEAQRMIRENGVTYNVYGDPRGLDRPWELDPIPLILSPGEWRGIELAVAQRARLWEAILSDVYGPQRLLRDGHIPPALVHDNAAFLRAAHAVEPAGKRRLLLYAAEIARTANGSWCVLADKSQPLAGAGYALENRLVVSRTLPALHRECSVHRLASFFAKAKEMFLRVSPRQASDLRVVLLTPGPSDRAYFEHVYLSRYLGLTLVESADLTVRDDAVFLKTLRGLYGVDVILSRLPESQLDPLEFGGDSTHGVAGLMRAVRAGRVALVNPVGSAVIESPAWSSHLPALCRHLLQEEPLFASDATPRLSTVPSWIDGATLPRHVLFRVYATAIPDGFAVMAGGLARSGTEADPARILAQRDLKSKDTWVLSDGPVSDFSLMRPSSAPVPLIRGGYYLPSRVADNLYWLGRYAERAEGQIHLLRFFYSCLTDDAETHRLSEMSALLGTFSHFFDCASPPAQLQLPESLEHILNTLTFHRSHEGSLRSTISGLETAAWRVRDRFTADSWRAVSNLDSELDSVPHDLPAGDVLPVIARVLTPLEAFSGLIQESMTRGHGWHFLDLGRRVERALYTSALLQQTWTHVTPCEPTDIESVLSVAVSLMTYRSRYQTTLQAAPAIDLLVCDQSNPRSLAFQLTAMENHVAMLCSGEPNIVRSEHERLVLTALTKVRLADPYELAAPDAAGARPALTRLLEELNDMLPAFSDALARAYFAPGQGPGSLEGPLAR